MGPMFLHKSQINLPLRGYEYYDSDKGSTGVFVECETIIKSNIPDVYHIKDKEGYVAVPDLKTSDYLRSMGSEFYLPCEEKDGVWYIKDVCIE